MASATFEVATLSDAVTKASAFTPTKGSLLDRCGGVVISVDPIINHACLRATDLESTYRQSIRLVDVEGATPFAWRISDKILEPVLRSIPASAGATVTIADGSAGRIALDAPGFTDTTLLLFRDPDAFPAVDAFDAGVLTDVDGFGPLVDRVAWAASKKSDVLSGVHLDGVHIYATNGTTAARVPLPMTLEAPITVPFSNAVGLLKAYPTLRLGATDSALRVQVDSDIQVTMTLLADKYPALQKFIDSDFAHSTEVPRLPLLELLNRLAAPFSDRLLRAELRLDADELSLTVEEPEVGRLGGCVELPGPAEAITMQVTIQDLRLILQHASSGEVEFSYTTPLKPIRFKDNTEFTAVTMPRRL